jgi:hypothetical protein
MKKNGGNIGLFKELCYGVSGVPKSYLEVLKISFNLSH